MVKSSWNFNWLFTVQNQVYSFIHPDQTLGQNVCLPPFFLLLLLLPRHKVRIIIKNLYFFKQQKNYLATGKYWRTNSLSLFPIFRTSKPFCWVGAQNKMSQQSLPFVRPKIYGHKLKLWPTPHYNYFYVFISNFKSEKSLKFWIVQLWLISHPNFIFLSYLMPQK